MMCLKNPPKYLICPINNELMEDPVCAADGHTYERKAIESWFVSFNISPVTGVVLSNKILKENFAIKNALEVYRENLSALGVKPCPVLVSNPLRDLYKTSYGHHFGEPFADISNEDLSLFKQRAEKALKGKFAIKYG